MEDRKCSEYAYWIDTSRPFSMVGVRQIFKLWHALAVVERANISGKTGMLPKILDVGCGMGEIGMILRQNEVLCDFHSVDLEQRFGIGSQPYNAQHHNMDLTEKSLVNLCGENHFDIVFMYDFLQNINQADGSAVIREVYRSLKPGGLLSLHTRNSMMRGDTSTGNYLYEPNIAELLAELDGVGFGNVDVFGVNYGYEEGDLPSPKTQWDRYMPDRIRRIMHGLGDYRSCKWALIDSTKVV